MSDTASFVDHEEHLPDDDQPELSEAVNALTPEEDGADGNNSMNGGK